MLDKLKTLFEKLPRSWSIILLAVLVFMFLLPDFSVNTALKFVTFFTIAAALGWGALRVFWIERTRDLESHDKYDLRALARDVSYAVMVSACLICAATLSL